MSEAAIQRDIVLTIPTPPSVNRLHNRKPGQKHVYATPAYRRWKRDAGWSIAAQRPGRIAGPYTVTLTVPMRGDADNRLKATIDLLVSLGITDDDKNCLSAMATKEPGRTDAQVVIRPASSCPKKLRNAI